MESGGGSGVLYQEIYNVSVGGKCFGRKGISLNENKRAGMIALFYKSGQESITSKVILEHTWRRKKIMWIIGIKLFQIEGTSKAKCKCVTIF